MRSKVIGRLAGAALAAGIATGTVTAGNLQQVIYYDQQASTQNGSIRDFIANSTIFPAEPGFLGALPQYEDLLSLSQRDGPVQASGNFSGHSAVWIRGWVEPPVDGEYTFYITGAQTTLLRMSVDDGVGIPGDWQSRAIVAETTASRGFDAWSDDPLQKTQPITLQKGQQYFIELLMKAGSANNSGQVRLGWFRPDYVLERPLPMRYTQRFAHNAQNCNTPPSQGAGSCDTTMQWDNEATIAVANIDRSAPANLNLREGQEVLVAPSLSFNPPVSFQWYDADTDQPLAGETLSHFSIERATLDDTQRVFLRVTKDGNSIDTGDVNISVGPDNTPPTIEFANASGNENGFTIQFSERVDPNTATNAANYQVVQRPGFVAGGTIDRVEMLYNDLEGDAVVVFLTEDGFTGAGPWDVVVNNVQDVASSPLTIAADARAQIGLSGGLISFRAYGAYNGGDAIGGVNVSDVLDNPSLSNRYPQNPDFTSELSLMEIPSGAADNYFGEMIGYFFPPEDGNYNFLMSADDQAVLFLGDPASEDPADPANKIAIAGEPIWNGDRNYATNDRRGGPDFTGRNQFFRDLFPDREQDARINESKNAVGNTLNLTGGARYFIQAVVKEGGGGDNLSVFMQTPSSNWNTTPGSAPPAGLTPIPGQYLSAYTGTGQGPIIISAQPQDQTVDENQPVVFTIQHEGAESYEYQWFRVTQQGDIIIPDADEVSLRIDAADPDLNGSQFKVRVRNLFSEDVSDTATITVTPDETKPTVVDVNGNIDFNQVIVTFSEPMNETDLTNPANYSITKQDGGALLAITGPITVGGFVAPGYTQAIIPTAAQDRPNPANPGQPNTIYEVAVSAGMRDLAQAQNQIDATVAEFQAWVITRGFVNYQIWTGVGGTGLGALHSTPGWPNSPTESSLLTAWEVNPNRDNYSARIRGFFYPQYNGRHDFYIAADDQAALYVSADANPVPSTDTARLALEPSWNDYRDWTETARRNASEPESRTDLNNNSTYPKTRISNMQIGQPQWMEVRWKEGGGGDSGAINVKTPAGPFSTVPANNSATRMTGGMIGFYANPNGASFSFTEQPQSGAFTEGAQATFSAAGSGEITGNDAPPTAYQWQRQEPAGTTWADIPGATGTSLTLTPDAGDPDELDGVKVRIQGMVPGATLNSDVATITVNLVTDPLDVASVRGALDPSTVIVTFERAASASAATPANYTLTGPGGAVAISGAEQQAGGTRVELTTASPLAAGASYTLNIANVVDTTTTGNAVDDQGGLSFTAYQALGGYFVREWYTGIGGGAVADMTGNAKYPDSPDEIDYIQSLEWNDGGFNYPYSNRDNYGTRTTGLISVSESGEYNFAISCDDQAFLYLSTDDTVGNKRRIAVEPNWQGFRQFAYEGRSNGGSTQRVDARGTYFPDNPGTTPINQSLNTVGAIQLDTGNQYYIEVLMKEGGGGDNLAVAWQLASEGQIATGTPGISGAAAETLQNPDNAINISAQPASSSVIEGEDANFSVTANATFNGPVGYQWQRQGAGEASFSDVAGATGNSLTVAATTAADNGAQYRVVMNAPGDATATSSTATLTVGDDPGVQPALSIAKTGDNEVTVSYPNSAAAYSLDATTAIGTAFAPDADQGADDGTNINRVKDTTTDSATFWRLSN